MIVVIRGNLQEIFHEKLNRRRMVNARMKKTRQKTIQVNQPTRIAKHEQISDLQMARRAKRILHIKRIRSVEIKRGSFWEHPLGLNFFVRQISTDHKIPLFQFSGTPARYSRSKFNCISKTFWMSDDLSEMS